MITIVIINGKDVVICGHEIADIDDNHCALCLKEKEKKRRVDTVSGIVSAVVSRIVFF